MEITIDQPRAARHERLLITLALAFGWLGAASLWLQTRDPAILAVLATLSAVAVVSHLWLNRVASGRDPLLLPLSILLTGWGLLVIMRVAPNFLGRQLVWVAVGYAAMLVVASSRDRLRWLRRFKYTWLLASLGLLAATLLLGVNPAGVGARLWLSVAGLFMQPSEVLRLLMIAFLAAFFSERMGIGDWKLDAQRGEQRLPHSQSLISNLKSLAPSFAVWLVALALLGTQQDLGAGALLLITFVFMLYLATGRALLPLAGMIVLVIAGVAGYLLSSRIAQRIDIWLNPWADPQGNSFQVVQSLIAIASGGVFGQGLGQGRPDYVPAVHTDFPFAAVGEEFGFMGALAMLIGLAALSLRAWRIARAAPSAYALLLAGGLAASLATQAFVIVGGNLGLLPLTGVTLPFVSYGGSSLLVSLIGVGLLIRLSCDHPPVNAHPVTGVRHTTPPGGTDSVLLATPIQRAATQHATLLCTGLFVMLALGAGMRGVAQGQMLAAREDNPRSVEAERAIKRGPLLARDGTPLTYSVLQSSQQPREEQPLAYVRHYPNPEAAPATGYYSLRYGLGGLEEYADATLRGQLSLIDRLLHRPQVGAPFTTTIDLNLQQAVAAALRNSTGSALVLDWRTGEVMALVSAPSFDANTLDEHWDVLRTRADAPLVNRVTQGLYQPGALLRWMREQAQQPGNKSEWDSHDRFSLGQPVPFELDNAAVPYPATPTYSETIGQGTLRVTPLRVATVAASLAAGNPITPTLSASSGAVPEHDNNAPATRLSPFTTFAQMGQDRYVGWHVETSTQHVWVIALEQRDTNPTHLNAIAAQVRTTLEH